jgi:hypothetical protein
MREELQLLPTLPSSYSRQRWVNVEPYSILRDLAAVAVAEIFVIYFTSDCDVSSLEAILLLSLYLLYSTICYITSAALTFLAVCTQAKCLLLVSRYSKNSNYRLIILLTVGLTRA